MVAISNIGENPARFKLQEAQKIVKAVICAQNAENYFNYICVLEQMGNMLLSDGISVAELHSDFSKNCQTLDHRKVLILAKNLHKLLDFGQSVIHFKNV